MRKIDNDKLMVVFACGGCGAAATWTGENVDVADDVPWCAACDHPMTFSGVCVNEPLPPNVETAE